MRHKAPKELCLYLFIELKTEDNPSPEDLFALPEPPSLLPSALLPQPSKSTERAEKASAFGFAAGLSSSHG